MIRMTWLIFWGVLLILIGLSVILKSVFNIDLPIIRVFLAFFLIYLGIRLFIGKDFGLCKGISDDRNIVFGSRHLKAGGDNNEYNFVFAQGTLDLSELPVTEGEMPKLKVNTIFGSSELILADSINYVINANAVFAQAKMPDGSSVAFGDLSYKTEDKGGKPVVFVETNTVFGETRIRFVK